MKLYWAKACAGQYFLRDKPGRSGPALGRVWWADMGTGAGTFYHALYSTPEAHINFTERGQPKTVIAMLEEQIVARFPEAEFVKEGFL